MTHPHPASETRTQIGGEALAERVAIVAYIRECAEAFAEVPIQVPKGPERDDAVAYSLDAVLRYLNLANHIEAAEHYKELSS
jgi:hypothetical protein